MAVIGDPNTSPQSITVTITLFNADGTTRAHDANGKLSEATGITGGFHETAGNSGIYTMTGNAATITTDLQGLIFTPTQHQARPGTVITTIFQIDANNGLNPVVSDSNTSVDVTQHNTAPTLIPANVVNPPSPVPASADTSATDPGITVGTLLNLTGMRIRPSPTRTLGRPTASLSTA